MSTRPALLAAFLCEVVINEFSFDTIQFVLDRVDLHLPGEAVAPPPGADSSCPVYATYVCHTSSSSILSTNYLLKYPPHPLNKPSSSLLTPSSQPLDPTFSTGNSPIAIAAHPKKRWEDIIHGPNNHVADSYQAPPAPPPYTTSMQIDSNKASSSSSAAVAATTSSHKPLPPTDIPYQAAGFWRSSLVGDNPSAAYASTPAEAARGPYYRRHR